MRNDAWAVGLFVGLIVGGIFIAALWQMQCDDICWQRFSGGKGWFELSISGLTLCVLTVGAYFAYQSFRMNRGIGRAVRFEKGGDLLGKDQAVTRFVGVALLEQVTEEDPELYANAVLRALGHYIHEADDDNYRAHERPNGRPDLQVSWTASNVTATEAVSTLAKIAHRHWPTESSDLLNAMGNLPVTRAYIADKEFVGDNFTRMLFWEWRIDRVNFVRVNFSDSLLELRVGNNVVLDRCTLRNARLIVEWDNQRRVPPQFTGSFRIEAPTDTTGCTINGFTYEEWSARARPGI